MKISKRILEMILCLSKQNLNTFKKCKAITLKEYLMMERIIRKETGK